MIQYAYCLLILRNIYIYLKVSIKPTLHGKQFEIIFINFSIEMLNYIINFIAKSIVV